MTAVGLALSAPVAHGDSPPDISLSTMTCADTDAGALRPGDDIGCTFYVTTGGGTEFSNVSAHVPLPAALVYVSGGTSHDDATNTIVYEEVALGLMAPDAVKPASFHVSLGDVLPGTSIQVGVDLLAIGNASNTHVTQHVDATALVVDPPPPDLAASTLACSDADGGQLLPGDIVGCDLTVDNAPDREQAIDVSGGLQMQSTTWASGGTSHFGTSVSWDGTDAGIGDVAPGSSKIVSASFQVSPSALGGTGITPSGYLIASGAKSGFVTQNVFGSALTVDPGPADLSPSSLVCSDNNGGLVLAGDDLRCSLSVAAAAGHQGVVGATGAVPVPSLTAPVTGQDGLVDDVLLFGASLGDVAAGASKTAVFHVRIDSGTPTGMVIGATGSIKATSIPAGTEVSRNLTAIPLTVGAAAPVAAQQGPVVPDPEPVAAPPAPAAPAAVSKAYKLKAKTIHIIMRKGRRRVVVDVRNKVTRTPRGTGKVVRKLTIAKKGKTAPRRGKVTVKGTRFTYILKKGKRPVDRFRYTVTDAAGKKVTGTVTVRPKKAKKKKA
jgi:hypothetical protein